MRTERSFATLRGRLARASRMATYGACVSMLFCVLGAGRVRAQVSETSRRTSTVIARLPELEPGLTRLIVNGESVHVAAGVVPDRLEDAVHRIEGSCRADIAGMEASETAPSSEPRRALLDALMDAARSMTTTQGSTTTVLCLADNDATRNRSFADRLAAFADTHDLASVGSLRQFVLTPGAGGTRVIAVWLPARFPLDRAFPEAGDAPGSDALGVPRPEASRRVLTAVAEGHPHVVRVYESTRSDVHDVSRAYLSALERHGWRAHAGAERLDGGTIFGLGERDLLVQVRADAQTGKVYVSTIEMRGPESQR